MSAPILVENFFRHEYGRLVSTLTRNVGVQHIEHVEDAVQSALMTALERWTANGLPENPPAWLFRVAQNNLLERLRRNSLERRILERTGNEQEILAGKNWEGSEQDSVEANLLRLLFFCCHDSIQAESQVVFALKTLCGFDVREIALRLFTSQANVYKRYSRARDRLRELSPSPSNFDNTLHESKLPAVHKTLYLLFTEGFHSSQPSSAIRHELCHEAIRLGALLAEHPVGQTPETFALMALMHLHCARMNSRQHETGELLLLEEQDRGLWDKNGIRVGLEWLAKSAKGDRFGRYHAEAGIAAEHCMAPSFQKTRWEVVVECYAMLEQIDPSPIHKLNRAVAVAELQGPAAGLQILESIKPPSWLVGSHLWSAVLADLHRRCGNYEVASRYRDTACASAPTSAIRDLLNRRFQTPN